jgi:predicted CoA-binding protein
MQSGKEAASAFLANKRVAVTGVSRTPKGHGSNLVYQRLRERGYEVFAVNPNAHEVEGDRSYQDLQSIPGGVQAVVIGTRPEIAEDTMRECAELGIKHVWMRRGPRRGQRLGRRHRLRPPARHHRDRWRLSLDVWAHRRFRAQDHALRARRARAQAGVNQRAPRSDARDVKREEKTMGANRKLLERYVELYNAGDLDACMDLWALLCSL